MTATAKAAVLVAPRGIELQEFALPEVTADNGLLRVDACGVCEADVPPFRGDEPGAGVALAIRPPVILGHEIVGTIAEVGEAAARRWGVTAGDRVVVERWLPCGHCEECYGGHQRLCRTSGLFYGGTPVTVEPSLWGGYADHLYLHADSLVHKVEVTGSAQVWSLFTPIANGISWISKIGGCSIGTTVVIEGPGQEGLGAVIAAREAGAEQIIVTGLAGDALRLQRARELGATSTVVVGDDVADAADEIRALVGRRGVDLVLDVTSGLATQPIELAVDVAAPGGTVVLAGGHRGSAVPGFQPDRVRMKLLTVRGVRGRDRASVKTALNIIAAGRYPLDALCSHTFSLDEVAAALAQAGGETEAQAVHVCVAPA